MPAPKGIRENSNLTDRATLSLLAALEGDESVTQRGLAARIGVALGLTNSLLKRAVKKGFVKVSQAPAKRFAYYVTPKGFGEKSRLVAEYLSSSLDFFRQVREDYADIYADALSQGHTKIVLFGTGELAEIATMSALASDIKVLAVVHPGSNQEEFSGLPVMNDLESLRDQDIDAVVITNADDPQKAYEALRAYCQDKNIYAPSFLHVLRQTEEKGTT